LKKLLAGNSLFLFLLAMRESSSPVGTDLQ
jgi:hypothetical protein